MPATVHPSAPSGRTPATAALRFAGGWTLSFVPLLVFLTGCVAYFVVFKAFDMSALAMSAFVGLLAGAVACREHARYWDAAVRGISSPASVTIVLILFVIGMYSELVKTSGVAGGFAWLAESLGITGAGFTLFTFLAVCVVAVSTGSSIGTMFTAFPVFFAAGASLGAEPAVLAGAIVSGAVFGDNLAPISDTTIISSSTQSFRTRPGTADVGGVVRSRAPYALVAAAASAVVFALLGGAGDGAARAPELAEAAAPRGLWMLLPIVAVLVVAVRTRDIFRAVAVGLVLGTLTALVAGLISPAQVLSVADGAPAGYLVTGVGAVLGTVALVIGVFGIMGVLVEAGVLERLTSALRTGRLGRTPAGAEVAIAVGSTATTVLFGGVNSASMIAFGPVADEIGGRVGLHPYRRSNVLDCFAMGLGCVVPFLSAFLFIGATLVEANGASISAGALFAGTVYPLALTAVMVVSVLTGWGRRFEAADSSPVKAPPAA
ncbi:Na+/H+ antiporter NhaC family protein [Kineococcus sp. SYSU DK001]|uniref:Na+/H+ antiporter NhaC family protein n=1 Tax=Kineococcus sp. SYSU DK001 TaxID=3383122 RepID=UPI003D7CC132